MTPIEELRLNGETLRKWLNSVVEQRRDAWAPRGVEVNASDALEAAFRIGSSVIAGLEQCALAIEALQSKEES